MLNASALFIPTFVVILGIVLNYFSSNSLRGEFNSLRGEVLSDITSLRNEMNTKMDDLKASSHRDALEIMRQITALRWSRPSRSKRVFTNADANRKPRPVPGLSAWALAVPTAMRPATTPTAMEATAAARCREVLLLRRCRKVLLLRGGEMLLRC